MPAGTLETFIICAPSGFPASPCPAGMAPLVKTGYLISQQSASVFDVLVDSQDLLNLLLNGGFDAGSFQLGFLGVVSMFCVGIGIGIAVGVVRKAR